MDLFTQTTGDTPPEATGDETNQASFFDQLVQAKGEQWRDPNVIAKGKMEADVFIGTLQAELAALKETAAKDDYARQLLTELKGTQAGAPVSPDPEVIPDSKPTENTTLGVTEIQSLVQEALSQAKLSDTAGTNTSVVEAKMVEVYGTEAKVTLVKKATELNMSLDDLAGIAAKSPEAFFQLVGVKRETTAGLATPNTVNTSTGFTGSGVKNRAYFDTLRRADPKAYEANRGVHEQEQAKQLVAMGRDTFFSRQG